MINNKLTIVGTDGKRIKISKLQKKFSESRCHSLKGFPKVFMIHVFNITDLPDPDSRLNIPDTATIFVSGYHDQSGSIFIRQLNDLVEKSPFDKQFSSFVEELKEISITMGWSLTYSLEHLQKPYFVFL